jgi:hypothetical protein
VRLRWLALGIPTVLAAVILVFAAGMFGALQCYEWGYSCDRTRGRIQFVIALVGLLPAVGTLVAGLRRGGHPSRWFAATVVVYSAWFVALE